jgi:hypothetical protein
MLRLFPPRDTNDKGRKGYRNWGSENKVGRDTIDKWVVAKGFANPIGAPKKSTGKSA